MGKTREDFVKEVSDHWTKASPEPLTRHMMREERKRMIQTFRLQRATERVYQRRDCVHPETDTGPAVGKEVW